MNFELTPPNKQFSDSELIDDLTRVAKELNKNNLTQREYDQYGKFSYQTQKKRFGSWLKALKNAGLEQSKKPWGGEHSETCIPKEILTKDIIKVAEILKKNSITIAEYDEHGKFGSATIIKRFGGWNKAKTEIGLSIGRVYNTTEEEYLENILHVWQTLGRQPRYNEMTAPISKLHISSYERKFGTWRKALNYFMDYINKKDNLETEKERNTIKPSVNQTTKTNSLGKITPANNKTRKEKIQKRTNRSANLRQRFRVMKRDNFKCVLCGATPAKNPECELHIDHIIPWSHGGETTEDNLRTLCSQCNLGRSNKE